MGACTTSFFQHIPSPARSPPGSSVGHDGAVWNHPAAPDSLLQRHDVPPECPGTLPSPAPHHASPPPSKTMPKMQGGTPEHHRWFLPHSPLCRYFNGVTLPLQSLPRKLGLGTPGAATPGSVPQLGASSAPAAPPKGLTGVGKPASPPGDGRVEVAWGLVGFGYPIHPPRGWPSPSSARWATSAGPLVPPTGTILA